MHTFVERAIWQIGRTAEPCGWMHLDAGGIVRVGAGMALADEEAARRLPFQVGTRAATLEEIGADFARVKGMPAGGGTMFYGLESAPVLEPEVIDALLRTTLVGLQVELREVVPGFDGLKDEAKSMLLQVCYLDGPGAAREAGAGATRDARRGGGLREIGLGLVGLVHSLLERKVQAD